MGLKNIAVPRESQDRSLVPTFQDIRDALTQHNEILDTYSVSLPVFPYGRELPRITGHVADANTVALWHGDPPDNGGSGLVDSSGNGFTLEVVGTAGYGELGCGREGFALDGTNYWRRAGTVNDATLNTTFRGDHTIEMLVRPMSQPNGMTAFDYGSPAAAGPDTDTLANINFKLANAAGGPNVASSTVAAYFYHTGAAVGHTVIDTKIFPINQVTHVAAAWSGTTLRFYINGFLQSTTGGGTARSALTTPTQIVRIGTDHNVANFFTGFIGSIKISNVARSEPHIFSDAAHCLGLAQFETSHVRPLMFVREPSVLLDAEILPDDRTGVIGARECSVTLYKIDSSGSALTRTPLAMIDGAAASARDWSAYRAQAMRVVNSKVVLNEGDAVGISGAGKLPNGIVSMTFGRVV